jgi:hypothetical protein
MEKIINILKKQMPVNILSFTCDFLDAFYRATSNIQIQIIHEPPEDMAKPE